MSYRDLVDVSLSVDTSELADRLTDLDQKLEEISSVDEDRAREIFRELAHSEGEDLITRTVEGMDLLLRDDLHAALRDEGVLMLDDVASALADNDVVLADDLDSRIDDYMGQHDYMTSGDVENHIRDYLDSNDVLNHDQVRDVAHDVFDSDVRDLQNRVEALEERMTKLEADRGHSHADDHVYVQSLIARIEALERSASTSTNAFVLIGRLIRLLLDPRS